MQKKSAVRHGVARKTSFFLKYSNKELGLLLRVSSKEK